MDPAPVSMGTTELGGLWTIMVRNHLSGSAFRLKIQAAPVSKLKFSRGGKFHSEWQNCKQQSFCSSIILEFKVSFWVKQSQHKKRVVRMLYSGSCVSLRSAVPCELEDSEIQQLVFSVSVTA